MAGSRWVSFWLGIGVSFAANIAAAPELTASITPENEIATFEPKQAAVETEQGDSETGAAVPMAVRGGEYIEYVEVSDGETAQVITLAGVSPRSEAADEPTAQEVMWAYFKREQTCEPTPTGAELDRVAGTNNYGRTVLRQWRNEGRIPTADQVQRVRGGRG